AINQKLPDDLVAHNLLELFVDNYHKFLPRIPDTVVKLTIGKNCARSIFYGRKPIPLPLNLKALVINCPVILPIYPKNLTDLVLNNFVSTNIFSFPENLVSLTLGANCRDQQIMWHYLPQSFSVLYI